MTASVFLVKWSNPYTAPPSAKRELGCVVFAPGLDPFRAYGTGYGIYFVRHWNVAAPAKRPPRRWSQQQKAAARQRNLVRRAERRAPLFADQIVQAELTARPDYFSATDAQP